MTAKLTLQNPPEIPETLGGPDPVPVRPEDPRLRELQSAAGELLAMVARRMIHTFSQEEAERIVSLLQEAAGAYPEEEPTNIGFWDDNL